MLDVDSINSYYGKSHVLHDVSVTADSGQMTTLLGRNGAGKSTLIKSIMGYVTVKSGTINLNDREITSVPTQELAALGIGYVPERREIFPNLTVDENLQLAQLNVDNPVDRQVIFEYFPRLEERVEQVGRSLSGGEQQMLAIARALHQDPELLLVDEPSEGLMPKLVGEVFEILANLRDDGRTILLTEQRAEKALEISDYAYVIENGAVVKDATPAEIRADEVVMDKYLSV